MEDFGDTHYKPFELQLYVAACACGIVAGVATSSVVLVGVSVAVGTASLYSLLKR